MAFSPQVRAVLFDRDATVVVDVPYNGNPDLVEPMPGAVTAVRRVKAAGLLTGIVSNQSGIGRGMITVSQVDAVNARVDAAIGPFDTWQYCPHVAEDRCGCRKPAAGLVLRACAALGVRPEETVVIGDIGADMGAAERAGARGILVPTPITRAEEIAAAPLVAVDLAEAVDMVLTWVPRGAERKAMVS